MTSRLIPVEAFDLVVFGATGDLARRKLLPALYHHELYGQLPASVRIIGAARKQMTIEEFRSAARSAIETHVPASELREEVLKRLLDHLRYVPLDAASDAGWNELRALLDAAPNAIRVFYLATSPQLFGIVCERIQAFELDIEAARVVVEKPIGKDLDSARRVNDAIARVFPEHRVYRIDHYLGKETVQNLLALRFANALFEPLWNSNHVDHVQITVAEAIGIEERGGYYDTAGALRDMVQNHLLQLLCLVAMEAPASMDADAVRDEKLKVLKVLRPIDASNAGALSVRGQYQGYLADLGASASETETFVAIKTEVLTWRWAGVPFYLRTGKCLPRRMSEIVISFRQVPHNIFGVGAGPIMPNRLVLRLQPDEGVKLWLMIKDPGPGGMRLHHVPLDMSFAEAFGVRNPDAYERLILDVVRGNQTLFMRRDEVEAAWVWIDPLLAAWNSARQPALQYAPGSWGPAAAQALIQGESRRWHEEA
ncbi:MAG: glucose-6-phosphate dehydrogenase [Casimicrobiaceae bacterium]